MGMHNSSDLLLRCPNGYQDFRSDMKKLNRLGSQIGERFNFTFSVKGEKSNLVQKVNKLWRMKGGIKIHLTLKSNFPAFVETWEEKLVQMMQRPIKAEFAKK